MSRDEDLRRRFEELGRADGASAPLLREVLERRRTSAPRRLPLPRLALAAVLAAAALTAALLLRPARPAPERERVATIVRWTSPTGWLLQTPERQLLEDLPSLPDSILGVGLPEGVGKNGRKTPTAPRGRRS